jgi:hypothetical protein
MNISEKFIYRLSNHCYYDFDSVSDCANCHQKEKCWNETTELLKEEEEEK